jgi:hypothetical protein
MSFFFRNRVKQCSRVILFEELEERIVMDASVDDIAHSHPLSSDGLNSNWNLDYGSDSSATMNSLLDLGYLIDYEGNLGISSWTTFVATATYPFNTTTASFSGMFQVTDATAGSPCTAVINLPAGGWTSFTATAVGGATINGGGGTVAGTTLSIVGTQADVNATLNTMFGTIPTGFTGNMTAIFTTFDNDPVPPNPSDTKSFVATIGAGPSDVNWDVRPDFRLPNSEPLPGGSGSATADGTRVVTVPLGGYFSVLSVDSTPVSKPNLVLSSPPGGGWYQFHATQMGDAAIRGNDTTSLTIQGTPNDIQATLETLYGTFRVGYNGSTRINCNYYDTDTVRANPGHPAAFTAIFIDGANGIPFITAPTTELVNQGLPFDFTGGHTISVVDPDWEPDNNHLFHTDITSTSGGLILKDTSALNKFTHPNDQTWHLEGYLPWINQALGSLRYVGTNGGGDTITVTVNDLGATGGAGVPLTDPPTAPTSSPVLTERSFTTTVAMTVVAASVDVTPQVTTPANDSFSGATTHAFATVWPDPTHVVQSPAADNLDLSILTHHGQLGFSASLPSNVTTLVSDTDMTGDSFVYLRGPVAGLNTALNTLTYTAYPGFTGGDILTLSVMDNTSHQGSRNPVQRLAERSVSLTVT